jgi:hypothetical protein
VFTAPAWAHRSILLLSTSVRIGIEPFLMLNATCVAALKDPSRHVPNPDMLMTPDMTGAVQDVITKFWNTNQSVDDAMKALQGALKG